MHHKQSVPVRMHHKQLGIAFLGLFAASQPLLTSAWAPIRSATGFTSSFWRSRRAVAVAVLPPIDVASALYSFQAGAAHSLGPTSGVLVYGGAAR
jgi:hypothetical protein